MAGQQAGGEIKHAVNGGHDGAGWRQPRGGLRLKVWTDGPELNIALRGPLEADAILEDLHRIMAEAHGQTRLHLDLSAVPDLDPLGVSALIVLLRHRGPAFEGISLTGLTPVAAWRFHNKGAKDLLGPDWDGCYHSDQASFSRH